MNPHPEQEQLSAFVDGELHDASVEQHIASCAQCARVVDALRATVADLHALPVPSLGDADVWAIKGAVSRARKRPERIARWSIASGSAAALLIGVIALVSRTSGSPTVSALGKQAAFALQVENTNYDSATAASLLDEGTVTGTGGSAGGSAGVGEMGPNAAPTSETHRAATPPRAATLGTQFASDSLDLATDSPDARAARACNEKVRASTNETLTLDRAILARYKGTPSILLLYRTSKRLELWVMRKAGCDVEFFAQRALK